jgi:N-acetylglucosamine-6-phosphate deacetylase
MSHLHLINARLPGYTSWQQVFVCQGRIEAIAPMTEAHPLPSRDIPVLDVMGDWISLGGVDLQINGALGLAFPDLNHENCDQLTAIANFLWSRGVDGFLPTIVTTSVENIQRSLAIISDAVTTYAAHAIPHTCQILGVHLEGPFLNPDKRGAHPPDYLLPLTIANVRRVLGDYAGIVKLMTIAPELDPTGQVIPYLKSLGITVSLGHSLATAAQAQDAFDQGASMVTHAFNAMPGLHHRQPGLLGAAITHPTVYCGLIADGEHVSPIMADILLRASHYQKGVFLVSDALAPLGLPDGIYPWDTRQITVNQGTARLADGTLSGTTLPLLIGVQNLVKWGICDVEHAIALATVAPRTAIGGCTDYIGQPASLLRWQKKTASDLTWERLTLTADGA